MPPVRTRKKAANDNTEAGITTGSENSALLVRPSESDIVRVIDHRTGQIMTFLNRSRDLFRYILGSMDRYSGRSDYLSFFKWGHRVRYVKERCPYNEKDFKKMLGLEREGIPTYEVVSASDPRETLKDKNVVSLRDAAINGGIPEGRLEQLFADWEKAGFDPDVFFTDALASSPKSVGAAAPDDSMDAESDIPEVFHMIDYRTGQVVSLEGNSSDLADYIGDWNKFDFDFASIGHKMRLVESRVQRRDADRHRNLQTLRASQTNFVQDEAVEKVLLPATDPRETLRGKKIVSLEEAALRGGLDFDELCGFYDSVDHQNFSDNIKGGPLVSWYHGGRHPSSTRCATTLKGGLMSNGPEYNFPHIPTAATRPRMGCPLTNKKDPGPTQPYVPTMTRTAAQKYFAQFPTPLTKKVGFGCPYPARGPMNSYQDYPLGFGDDIPNTNITY
ncbi:hypothetical protein BJ508DRAFT_68895 [Ascobolus immersus RN42]|uniref:Uncharacterized protein n=1 Tax=Ascobolus immersus RN42 TaxID=1160509 RepID=A0A3N4HEQ7_ASCIM|nr:hypothetical protein BJ508DRAFT_68895 [Ascobolus immersus RN42]